jgi:hypothetical protein
VKRALDEIRWTATVIAIADAAVAVLACVIALALGSFERGTIGLLILGAAGLTFLMVLGSAGGMPIGGGLGGVGTSGNMIHNQVLVEQSLRDSSTPSGLKQRTMSGVGLAIIGASLLVIGFAVVG